MQVQCLLWDFGDTLCDETFVNSDSKLGLPQIS